MDVIISVLNDYFRWTWKDTAAIVLIVVLSFIIMLYYDK